jgi:hypothetical protein
MKRIAERAADALFPAGAITVIGLFVIQQAWDVTVPGEVGAATAILLAWGALVFFGAGEKQPKP